LEEPSLIFGTEIKIFLMKSESFLTLHGQQSNYHIQGQETSERGREELFYQVFFFGTKSILVAS